MYWLTVSVEVSADEKYLWQLQLALLSNSEERWTLASAGGFANSSEACSEGMEALSLFDSDDNPASSRDDTVCPARRLH